MKYRILKPFVFQDNNYYPGNVMDLSAVPEDILKTWLRVGFIEEAT